MYSIVLMAAVTMGPDTASFGKRGGCCGGCYGGCYGGCCGGCYGGCYGGGGCHGRRHGCCGGYGGCYGGCWGGCYGTCYGGGYGGGYGGCCGGWSGCYGGGYGGCCGGYGGGYGGYMVPPGGYQQSPMQIPAGPEKKPAGASLKFQMPTDAKLYVDNQLTTSTGTERAFVTPSLTPGQKYYYDVKAELVVAGQTVTEERRVIVESGAEVVTTFPKLTAAMTTKPAGVASK